MQPISPDYQVVGGRRCIAEGRFDPFSVVVHGRDPNAEAIIDVVAHGFVQDAGEVTPENLQLAADDFGGQSTDLLTAFVDEDERTHPRGTRSHRA